MYGHYTTFFLDSFLLFLFSIVLYGMVETIPRLLISKEFFGEGRGIGLLVNKASFFYQRKIRKLIISEQL